MKKRFLVVFVTISLMISEVSAFSPTPRSAADSKCVTLLNRLDMALSKTTSAYEIKAFELFDKWLLNSQETYIDASWECEQFDKDEILFEFEQMLIDFDDPASTYIPDYESLTKE